jgi:hypothetical protein
MYFQKKMTRKILHCENRVVNIFPQTLLNIIKGHNLMILLRKVFDMGEILEIGIHFGFESLKFFGIKSCLSKAPKSSKGAMKFLSSTIGKRLWF